MSLHLELFRSWRAVATVGVFVGSTVSLGQSGSCTVPPCDGVWFGPVTLPPAPAIAIDRRPVAVIQAYRGTEPGRPTFPGVANWWGDNRDRNANGVSDAVDELLRRLDSLYARGFRRFMINRPMGHCWDNDTVTASCTHTIPGWKRGDLRREVGGLKGWITAHTGFSNPLDDASVGIYVGYKLNGNVCSLCDNQGANLRIPSTLFEADMCEIQSNMNFWKFIGCKEVWFDHVGGPDKRNTGPTVVPQQVASLIDLQYTPEYYGARRGPRLRFGAEPHFIRVYPQRVRVPDVPTLSWLPWRSSVQFLSQQGLTFNNPQTWRPEYVFDPQTTECHVTIEEADLDRFGFTIDTAYRFYERGWILWAQANAYGEEIVQRIHNLAPPPCPFDLNMDGAVDILDLGKVQEFINLGVANPIPLYHGDFNRDGRLDETDLLILSANLGACP